jgi:hypothetical protein
MNPSTAAVDTMVMTSKSTSEDSLLPHEAQGLAAEALMLAQEAKDIAKRLAFIKTKLASMTMTVKTMDPVSSPPAADDAVVIQPVDTMKSTTPFEDDKAQVIAAAAIAAVASQGSVQTVPATSSPLPSATASAQRAKDVTAVTEKEAAVEDAVADQMADDGISTLTSVSSDQTSSTATSPATLKEKTGVVAEEKVVTQAAPTTILKEKTEVVAEEEPVVPQEHTVAAAAAPSVRAPTTPSFEQSEKPDIEMTDDVVDNVMASRSVVVPDEPNEEVDKKTAPRDPSVIEECSKDASIEPEAVLADEKIGTKSIAQVDKDEVAVAAATVEAEVNETAPPKAQVPSSIEKRREFVSRQIEKGAFESLLDGVGVDRMCGVDDAALGLSSSTSTEEEEPTVAPVANPTKLTLSSEKDVIDPFGPDHDALAFLGKMADLCDVQLDQTLSNYEESSTAEDDDATIAASIFKSLDKHVLGFM